MGAALPGCAEHRVYSLDTANRISTETAKLAAEKGCVAVPPRAYDALWLEGKALGHGPAEFDKIEVVRSGGLKSLQIMRDAGLPMAFGSDLLGGLRKYHCMEFELLAKVLTPAEIIRSATVVGAELCQMTGQIGTIAAGAFADLVVVGGLRSGISRCCRGWGAYAVDYGLGRVVKEGYEGRGLRRPCRVRSQGARQYRKLSDR
jgi:imidazolonepropionase-like amidohydrolase